MNSVKKHDRIVLKYLKMTGRLKTLQELKKSLDRKQKKDRMLMMKIVYSLQKLTKKKEIMGAGLSEEVMTPKAFRIGSRLFNLCSEIVLGVLVSFLISIVVMIYFNIYFGLILVPVLGYGTFYFFIIQGVHYVV